MKTRTSTRMLSLLLAVLMIVTILPAQFATAVESEETYQITVQQMESVSLSNIKKVKDSVVSSVSLDSIFTISSTYPLSVTNNFKEEDEDFGFKIKGNAVADGVTNSFKSISEISKFELYANIRATKTGGSFVINGYGTDSKAKSITVNIIVTEAVAEDVNVNVKSGVETAVSYEKLVKAACDLWDMEEDFIESFKITELGYSEERGNFTYGTNRNAVGYNSTGLDCVLSESAELYYTASDASNSTATYKAEIVFKISGNDPYTCVYSGKINMTATVINKTVNIDIDNIVTDWQGSDDILSNYWIYKETTTGSIRRDYISGYASLTLADIEAGLGDDVVIETLTVNRFTISENNAGIYREGYAQYVYGKDKKTTDEMYKEGIIVGTSHMYPEEETQVFDTIDSDTAITVYVCDISKKAYLNCTAETNNGTYVINLEFTTRTASSVSLNAFPATPNCASGENNGFGEANGLFRIPVIDLAQACGVSTAGFNTANLYIYVNQNSVDSIENYVDWAEYNDEIIKAFTGKSEKNTFINNLKINDPSVPTTLTYFYITTDNLGNDCIIKGTMNITPSSASYADDIEKDLTYAQLDNLNNYVISVTYDEIREACGQSASEIWNYSNKCVDVFFYESDNIVEVTKKVDSSNKNAVTYEFVLEDPLKDCSIDYVVATTDTSNPIKYKGTINFCSNKFTADDITIQLGENDTVANIALQDIYNACGIGTNIIYTNDIKTNTENGEYFPRVRFTSIPSSISNVYANDKKTSGDILKQNLDTNEYSYIYSTTSYEVVPNTKLSNTAVLTYEIDILYTLNNGDILPDGSATADKTMQVLCRYTGKINIIPYKEEVVVEKTTKDASGDITYQLNASDKTVSGIVSDISAKCGNKEITKITFTFTSSDVAIKLGNDTVSSGTAYDVLNSSAMTFTAKNYTSDIRVYYTVETADAKYNGSIMLEKIKTVEVASVTKYAIYNGTTKNYNAEINVSDFGIKETITEFKVSSVTFKPAGTTAKKDNISGSAEYGYLTSTDNGKTAIKTFAANSALYYNPGKTAGTVEIEYVGYSSTSEYKGTIVVTVYNGADQDVSLSLKSRDPYLLTSESKDKTTFSKALLEKVTSSLNDKTVTLSYVVFGTPASSSTKIGTLYSNDNCDALSTNDGYYFDKAVTGKATLAAEKLYYVPSDNAGTYAVDYTVGVVYNNTTYELTGTLQFITAADELIDADVIYNTTNGKSVSFSADDFQSFVSTKNSKYVLKSIVLTEIPTVGTISQGSSVLAAANISDIYYASGSGKTIAQLNYTPKGYNYYETIEFSATVNLTSSSSSTTTVSGTILIVVTKDTVEDITYSVNSTGTLYMKAGDFYSVCTDATGSNLDHVYFDIGSVSGGTIYYNTVSKNNKIQSSNAVYYNTSKTPNLAGIIFDPDSKSGTVTIPYNVYTSGGTYLYTGYVKVNVFTEVSTPNFKRCVKSSQKILFNGKEITLDAYLIDDYNYVKLRDIAYIMNGTGSQFSVNYDSKNVYCDTGKTYVPSEDDMQTGADKSSTCKVSSFTIYVDDIYQSAYVYNIGGNNYFKLRDLGTILGFDVDWDDKNGIIIVNSSDYRGN